MKLQLNPEVPGNLQIFIPDYDAKLGEEVYWSRIIWAGGTF